MNASRAEIMKQSKILKEKMLDAGYPFCYSERGVPFHCEVCQKQYERIKEENDERVRAVKRMRRYPNRKR